MSHLNVSLEVDAIYVLKIGLWFIGAGQDEPVYFSINVIVQRNVNKLNFEISIKLKWVLYLMCSNGNSYLFYIWWDMERLTGPDRENGKAITFRL